MKGTALPDSPSYVSHSGLYLQPSLADPNTAMKEWTTLTLIQSHRKFSQNKGLWCTFVAGAAYVRMAGVCAAACNTSQRSKQWAGYLLLEGLYGGRYANFPARQNTTQRVIVEINPLQVRLWHSFCRELIYELGTASSHELEMQPRRLQFNAHLETCRSVSDQVLLSFWLSHQSQIAGPA